MNIVPTSVALIKTLSPSLVILSLAILVTLFPGLAFADTDKTLPYEEGIEVIYNSMTGPVPFVISLVGIIACGAMLIFGGEISGFMRTIVFVILVVAIIVQAGSVVEMLGGHWGAATPRAGTVGKSQLNGKPS